MSRMVRAGMQRTRAMVRSAAVFLVAVTVFVASESMVDHVNIMHCQVDLLLDEFGVVMLEMSAEKKHCLTSKRISSTHEANEKTDSCSWMLRGKGRAFRSLIT